MYDPVAERAALQAEEAATAAEAKAREEEAEANDNAGMIPPPPLGL